MKPRQLVIGLDVGSSGVKGAVYDYDNSNSNSNSNCNHDPSSRVQTQTTCMPVASVSTRFAKGMQDVGDGKIEQQCSEIWEAVVECLHQLIDERVLMHGQVAEQEIEIVALTLGGAMQQLCVPETRDAMICYSDSRASKEAHEIETKFESVSKSGKAYLEELTGNWKGATSILPKLLWLQRHETQVLKTASHVLLGSHSYIAWKLTGNGLCDFTTASTTGLLNSSPSSQQYVGQDVFSRAGLDSEIYHKLPRLTSAVESWAGRIWIPEEEEEEEEQDGEGEENKNKNKNKKERSIFPRCLQNVPVLAGSGDVGSTTAGAELLVSQLGSASRSSSNSSSNSSSSSGSSGSSGSSEISEYIYLGTSGWIARSSTHQSELNSELTATSTETPPVPHPKSLFILPHPKQGTIRAASSTTVGGNITFCLRLFGLASVQEFEAKLSAEFESTQHSGLLYLPYLSGERPPVCDPKAKGAFFGLNLSTTQSQMMLAVVEGIAFHFRWLQEILEEEDGGSKPTCITGNKRKRSISEGTGSITNDDPLRDCNREIIVVGGMAKNGTIRQIFANILNRDILWVPHQDIAVLGSIGLLFEDTTISSFNHYFAPNQWPSSSSQGKSQLQAKSKPQSQSQLQATSGVGAGNPDSALLVSKPNLELKETYDQLYGWWRNMVRATLGAMPKS